MLGRNATLAVWAGWWHVQKRSDKEPDPCPSCPSCRAVLTLGHQQFVFQNLLHLTIFAEFEMLQMLASFKCVHVYVSQPLIHLMLAGIHRICA